jgi:purine-binding chemotaxis protein CheW
MSENGSREDILKARARALARVPPAETSDASIEVVEFALAGERYGVEAGYVGEVFPFRELTPVPCTPAFFAGIVNVRGRLVAVVDLKRFFDLPAGGLDDLHKVIILRGAAMDLGVLADDVVGVRSVPLSQMQASLPTLSGIGQRYLRGVTGERLVVLDAARILGDPRILVQEEVQR